MTRLVLLGTGGTIASRAEGGVGAVARDGAATLLGDLAPDGVEVEALDILRRNSFAITPADQRTIAHAVRAQLTRADIDGIVVTHGTDTLEESAFLVDLAHDDPRPVVFTGAQRAADRPDADGPANLVTALAVAAAPDTRDRGVLVAFGTDVLAARGVRKMHTLAPQPFADPDAGPIGSVTRGVVALGARRPRPLLGSPDERYDATAVEIVTAFPGADDGQLRSAADRGARGIVVAGFGAGNPTPAMTAAIADLVGAGVLVALGTRVAAGPVAVIYGGGGAVDAVGAGAVPLGGLGLSQGRVAAALLLSRHPAPDAARRLAAFVAASEPAPPPS